MDKRIDNTQGNNRVMANFSTTIKTMESRKYWQNILHE